MFPSSKSLKITIFAITPLNTTIMKIKLLLLFFGLSFITASAQFGPQQIISNNVSGASRAIPYDVDSDGFIDIISAYSTKIVWFRNQDGQGNFSEEQIITNSAFATDNMELFDLNNDGYLDIIYKTNLSKFAWLENLDGLGTFGTEQIIVDAPYPSYLDVADIDGDGDLDISTIVFSPPIFKSIIWYENLDGQGNFGTAINIETTPDNPQSLELFDLDNDGDQDIICSFNNGPARIIWYENLDGLGNFDSYKEIYQFPVSPNSAPNSSWTVINNIVSSDFNNDGKIDLLIDTTLDEPVVEHIYWLENLDNQGSFGLPQHIHNEHIASGSLLPFDIDNDGDLDILVGIYEFNHLENSTIAWFKNEDGLGDFGVIQIISTEVIRAKDASAADLNGDGLPDVISASSYDNKVAWYGNSVLEIQDNHQNKITLYPNPTNGKLYINSKQEIVLVEVYDLVGKKVLETKTEIDLSNLVSGIYFVKIEDQNGFSETHKVIKE